MAASPVAPQTIDSSQGSDLLALWTGILLPPLAWFLNQQLSYMLVLWTCSTGRQFVLHLVTVAMLLLAGAGGFIAWRNWQRTRHHWPDEAGADTLPRSRFMAVAGLLSSGMFVLIILAQGIPSFLLNACAP
jgi:hypothetical protein